MKERGWTWASNNTFFLKKNASNTSIQLLFKKIKGYFGEQKKVNGIHYV
jgi:hypothetical protein